MRHGRVSQDYIKTAIDPMIEHKSVSLTDVDGSSERCCCLDVPRVENGCDSTGGCY
ncbi:hypothetical protein BCR44DRAFT_1437693 [Catenaria anguillulae PL171]|uniref:Uncharacterized protein n=1 Tax=Catenaria anguillulae PL171 TaxID=765915 RepID=A0A1Y2HL70_9FUNG|nr:hypothetical protein BCR44DRAFT_1437693 [Catenaria anguillulae PL171]